MYEIVTVYHPIVCRETTAFRLKVYVKREVYHPIVCRETTAQYRSITSSLQYITLLSVGKPRP